MSLSASASVFKCIRWTRFRLVIQAVDPIVLRGFIGPTLRGLLGEALHDSAGRDSEARPPGQASLFRTLFEGVGHGENPSRRPPPYLLHPPGRSGLRLGPGDMFDYELTLVGDAARHAPTLFRQLYTFGLNGGVGRHRARFLLKEVWAGAPGGEVLIFGGMGGLLVEHFRPEWSWNGEQFVERALQEHPPDIRAITLELVTPLDLRAKGKPVSDLTFSHIFRSVLRSLASYARSHGDGKLPIDFQAWKAQARSVAKTADRTRVQRVVHYSRRQFDRDGTPRRIGVTSRVGTLTFEGELSPFLPFLALATRFHVGKGRTMGFGVPMIQVRS